jgi:hypothetical protein
MCSSTPQYTSACCGATFTHVRGPDNIVELNGVLSDLSPDTTLTVSTTPDHTRDLGPEDAYSQQLPEAYRDGQCPACGAETPLLKLMRNECGSGTADLGTQLWRGLAYLGELALWFLFVAGIGAIASLLQNGLRELLAEL